MDLGNIFRSSPVAMLGLALLALTAPPPAYGKDALTYYAEAKMFMVLKEDQRDLTALAGREYTICYSGSPDLAVSAASVADQGKLSDFFARQLAPLQAAGLRYSYRSLPVGACAGTIQGNEIYVFAIPEAQTAEISAFASGLKRVLLEVTPDGLIER